MKRALLFTIGPLVILGIVTLFYLTGGRYVVTDNAYVRAGMVSVAANVSGELTDILVHENQAIRAGDILFRIDPRAFEIALWNAEAALAASRQEIEATRARLARHHVEKIATETDVAYWRAEVARMEALRTANAVSEVRLEELRHSLNTSRARAAQVRKIIAEVEATLGPALEGPLDSHPLVRQARLAIDQAALQLGYTNVVARVNGIVARIDSQPGEYVTAGVPVFAMIATDSLWLEANIKETDLTYLLEGQPAEVTADAFPDMTFLARVSSISPATGAEYAVLPPQNATGNWVKITQRIPVHLEIENPTLRRKLRAGMSLEVRIDTGHSRWPEWLEGSLGQ